MDLTHISLRQLLNFILMCLIELVDLVLGLFFADDRLPLAITEALQDALMVQFLLLFLLLLLLQLQSHELILLFGDRCIFDSLALERFVLVL